MIHIQEKKKSKKKKGYTKYIQKKTIWRILWQSGE